eukprot:359832-Chlamydomonas_euryale.AAC.3
MQWEGRERSQCYTPRVLDQVWGRGVELRAWHAVQPVMTAHLCSHTLSRGTRLCCTLTAPRFFLHSFRYAAHTLRGHVSNP